MTFAPLMLASLFMALWIRHLNEAPPPLPRNSTQTLLDAIIDYLNDVRDNDS